MLRELHSLVGGLFSKSQAEEKVVNSYFWALLKYENKIIGVSQCSLHQQLHLKDILAFLPLKFRLDFKGLMKFPGTSGVMENGGDWGWRRWK